MKKNFKNILEVRNSIDKIDEEILDLLLKRKELVVEAVKQKNRDQIVDQVRIDKIIERLKEEGNKRGLPGSLVEKLWLTMIQEFILSIPKPGRKKIWPIRKPAKDRITGSMMGSVTRLADCGRVR